MSKEDLAEIIFVLDKSGSMESIRRETLTGFNGFIRSQAALPGEARLTLVLFDTDYSVAYAGVPLREVIALGLENYVPGGGTALLDAVGTAIDRTGQRISALAESERPGKVMVVVLTDGEDNSSREYSVDEVKRRVGHQAEKYGWESLFLGANQDSWSVAGKMGMERAVDFEASGDGVETAYMRVDEAVREVRGGGKRG